MINNPNRSKIFLAIISILLAANIALVSFFLLKKDEGRYEKRPDKKAMITAFLKNEIGFDTGQLKQYEMLSDRHKEKMKIMMDSLRTPKDLQFKELAAANFNDSAMNSMAEKSGTLQKAMELRMFNHLRKIRLLCKSEQLPKFDSLFWKVFSRRGGDGRKNDPGNIQNKK